MTGSRRKSRWWKGRPLLLAVLLVVGLAATYFSGPQRLEYLGYGYAGGLIPQPGGDPRTVVVTIDEAALEAYGPWPWPHDRLAALVERIHGAQARGIGLLLPLEHPDTPGRLPELLEEIAQGEEQIRERLEAVKAEPRPSGSAARERRVERIARLEDGLAQLDVLKYWLGCLDTDRDLARALAGAQDAVLAARPVTIGQQGITSGIQPHPLRVEDSRRWYLHPSLSAFWAAPPAGGETGVARPFEVLSEAAAGVGLFDAAPARPEVGVRLARPMQEEVMPGFAAVLAAEALDVAPDELVALAGEGLDVGFQFLPTGPDWMFLPIPPGRNAETLPPVVSAARVLDDGDVSVLRDRTVVVGLSAGALIEDRIVPGGTRLSPALWMARAVDGILRAQWVSMPSWFFAAQRGLILACALFLLLLPVRFIGGLGGLLISLLIGILLLNGGLLALIGNRLWLPVVLPAIFLWASHIVLALYARFESRLRHGQEAAAEAWRQLGLNLQAQGQLDPAFEQFRKIPVTDTVLHHLYQLGHDFERRRQFTKAHAVYEYMAQTDSDYRDILVRQERLKPLSEPAETLSAPARSTVPATLVLDDPGVAKPMIGRYQIESQIGRGAMGVVYLGVDPKIGRKVAIKTLNLTQEFGDSELEEVKMRFYREAEASGRLQHPNIVSVYDVGEEHDLAYIAMDYVSGSSLEHYTREQSLLPPQVVLTIGIQTAEALDYAHRQNVVHRDIKPGNIIYDAETGKLKITDFGIACLTDNSKTKSGTLLGTPAYMSPEQITGDDVDGRSDIFSLGATLYHLFVGRLPFTGDSMANLVYKITSKKAEDIHRLRPELPASFTRIVNKCLEKEPGKRYQSGANLATALRRALEQWQEDERDFHTDTHSG